MGVHHVQWPLICTELQKIFIAVLGKDIHVSRDFEFCSTRSCSTRSCSTRSCSTRSCSTRSCPTTLFISIQTWPDIYNAKNLQRLPPHNIDLFSYLHFLLQPLVGYMPSLPVTCLASQTQSIGNRSSNSSSTSRKCIVADISDQRGRCGVHNNKILASKTDDLRTSNSTAFISFEIPARGADWYCCG